MIPVGDAFDKTGTTKLIADGLVSLSGDLQPIWILALLLLVTMLLTDIVNNAATALLMAPLGIDIAQRLKANPDTFLMIVAVGASCAFLTPIGHQNNLLVMGRSEEQTSELQSLMRNSYAVFCLQKKKK